MGVQELWPPFPALSLWEQEEHYWKIQRESHEERTSLMGLVTFG